jgi:diacylglycerol kinase family enzyme
MMDQGLHTIPQAGSALRQAVLFINTGSGSAANKDLDQRLVQVLQDKGGMAVRLMRLEAESLGQQVQALGREEPSSLPIIGGGDGTIRAAAQVMLGSGRPWGVLPLGTYNHFAQDLGFAAEPQQAAEQLATGVVRPIDAGVVNGHVFVNNASLGAYPLAVKVRDMLRSSMGLPKKLAMAYAFWKLFWRFRSLTIRLETASGSMPVLHAPFLLISNNLYEKMSLTAVGRPRLDAGILGMYCLPQNNRWAFLAALFHGMMHSLKDNDALVVQQARCLDVHLHRRLIPVALDGEVLKLRTPLHVESRPQALHLVVPAARQHG